MRSAVFLYAIFHVTVVAYCVGLTDVDEQSRRRHKTKEDTVELRKAAQRLLGLRQLPSGSGRARDFDVKMAPKYMLDLYEKYKDGRFRNGKRVANTVRSIQAEVGVINTRSMFVFNLSSIFTSEKILKAEVHLYKRHVRRAKDSDIYMEMNELGPTFLRKLDHRRIPEVAQGWQAADVTTAVEACLDHGDGLSRMMALAFLTPADGVGGDGLTRMNARWLVRRISRPYLIVYSNDTQNISVDHIQPHIDPDDLSATYVDPSTGLLHRFNIADHDREERVDAQEEKHDLAKALDIRQTGNGEHPPEPPVEQKVKDKKHKWRHHRKNKQHNEADPTKGRRRRSVLDNEIPEDPDEEVSPDAGLPRTNPGILLSRQQLRRKLSRHDADGGKLIPYPEGYKRQRRKERRRRRRKHRKNRGNRQRHPARTAPGPFREQWDLDGFLAAGQVSGLCKKRTLSVDFADIGWSDWIISPRSFEANYCSGSCPFPLAQRLKPSNHATIQSLVHAIGINSQVPGPCCVPDKLSAVTLLYFDENKNVVLKNYPEMSVDSCSCR